MTSRPGTDVEVTKMPVRRVPDIPRGAGPSQEQWAEFLAQPPEVQRAVLEQLVQLLRAAGSREAVPAAGNREDEIGHRLGLLADLEDRHDPEAREEERRVRSELEALEAAEAADLADEWDRPASTWREGGPEVTP
jgi:hypothetical protein